MLAWRGLSVVVGLVFALFGVALLVELLTGPLCSEASFGQTCFDGSSGERTIILLIGIPAAVLGIATLAASIYFAATGRRQRLLLILGAATLVLVGALALLSRAT